MRCILFSFYILFCGLLQAQNNKGIVFGNNKYSIVLKENNCKGFGYFLKRNSKSINLTFPCFEIDGRKTLAILNNVKLVKTETLAINEATEYQIRGNFNNNSGISLIAVFRIAPDNAVLRFHYLLRTKESELLSKQSGKDNISYFSFFAQNNKIKEIRLSEFNERFHATHITENILDNRYFKTQFSFMGPIVVGGDKNISFLAAYEHGSQFPDRFLEFQLGEKGKISLRAVKGNYLNHQLANEFSSIWLEFAMVDGNEDVLSKEYRVFVLKFLTQNKESRKPYIFYNTWGRQERVHWTGKPYLSSMNLDWTLKEIDRAHAMGIEVYVLDAGWFNKTGDWEVNKEFFPDELMQVRAKIEGYGMKLGLWFNPTVAAISSNMYEQNKQNRISIDGKYPQPYEIWETEKSVGMCLVSSYWENFANKLVSLSKKLGVTYFKWDAIGQYGCNDTSHYHGTSKNSLEERTIRYAFLQPEYMTKIVDKVCEKVPGSIFDFDITEDGRCVGLQFLSAGKYFIINNGPYFHNFDLAPVWKSNLSNNNSNIFVEPGPARGWFVRSVLDYDRWIPSILFLTHYQPDEPRNSQIINIASLILGQNGIWGEILKTSESGVNLFDTVISKYKRIRNDITLAQMVRTGDPGGSPEVYEKINSETGKGCVVIFASAKGSYTYITNSKTVTNFWFNEGVIIKKDILGRSIITVQFHEPSAKIILFGTD
ncbi:MAG: hypothetical protein NVS1B13_17560 [Flavisolibacter sp.]